MSKIAIMQPYFFPYIGYFQLINYVDDFLVYGNVSFRKKSWISRNRLIKPNSKEAYFIHCPIQKSSSNLMINQLKIDNLNNWKKRLLKEIEYDYRKKPYYNENIDFIRDLILFDEENFINYLFNSIFKLSKYLDIKTNIILDDKKFKDIEKTILSENYISETNSLKSDRIIKICKKLNKLSYINPSSGSLLYHKDEFKKQGINLEFLQAKIKEEYSLSIIDVLFNYGKNETQKLVKISS